MKWLIREIMQQVIILTKDTGCGEETDPNVNRNTASSYLVWSVLQHRYVAVEIKWLSRSKTGKCENEKKSEAADTCTNLGVAEQCSSHTHQLSFPYREVLSILQHLCLQFLLQSGDLRWKQKNNTHSTTSTTVITTSKSNLSLHPPHTHTYCLMSQ